MPRLRLLLDFLAPRRSYAYGREHNCQRAELWLPGGGGPHPVSSRSTAARGEPATRKFVMRGLAGDLVRRGFAVWNIDYRRVGRGQGGGWPATFLDVAAAIDALASLQAPLDLGAVTILGHSAGASSRSGPAAVPACRPRRPARTRSSRRRDRRPASARRPRRHLPGTGGRRRRRADGRRAGAFCRPLRARRPDRASTAADPGCSSTAPTITIVSVRPSATTRARLAAAGGTVELVEIAATRAGATVHTSIRTSAAWAVVVAGWRGRCANAALSAADEQLRALRDARLVERGLAGGRDQQPIVERDAQRLCSADVELGREPCRSLSRSVRITGIRSWRRETTALARVVRIVTVSIGLAPPGSSAARYARVHRPANANRPPSRG